MRTRPSRSRASRKSTPATSWPRPRMRPRRSRTSSRKAPDFDEVKGQIETYVTGKAQADYVAKLREGAKVERMDQAAADPAKADAKPDPAKPADSKMAPAKK